jgi:hypothetical protein
MNFSCGKPVVTANCSRRLNGDLFVEMTCTMPSASIHTIVARGSK